VRLERLCKGLAVCSGKTVAAHWVVEPVAEASAFGSSGAAPESSVIAYGMKDVVMHRWANRARVSEERP
jgi:hypothetical protein